jgi:DNA-binding response OmpR family regulator
MESEPWRLPIRVAVMADSSSLQLQVFQIVTNRNWVPVEISVADLERTDGHDWELVVICSSTPGLNLARVCAIASRFPRVGVIVTAPFRDAQVVADILNAGADDYIVAPFDPTELDARMHGLVGRVTPGIDPPRGLTFDIKARTVSAGSAHVTLSPCEWNVLIELLAAEYALGDEHPVMSWPSQEEFRPANLASIVRRIRQKFEQQHFDMIQIKTIRGQRYVATVHQSSENSCTVGRIG